MLTSDLVNDLLAPIAADDPCGPDLEYDPAFMVLVADLLGKPEQQFGDTIIAAIEPDWAQIGAQATGILKRSKDLRGAVLLLRAATRTQGLRKCVWGSSCCPACSTGSGTACTLSSTPTTTTTRPCA